MKDELNRKVITRCIGNDFEVYMKYRFGLGWIRHEKWVKNTHSGYFSGSPTGRIEVLPVELRYWSFLAKSYR